MARKLLCIGWGEFGNTSIPGIQLNDWEIHTVPSIKAGNRLLREHHFLVGLMFLRDVDDSLYSEIDDFLKVHDVVEWVGVFPSSALSSPNCRELILSRMFDFHTLPVDASRLALTVGHAYGRAALRERSIDQAENHIDLPLVGQSDAMQILRRQLRKVANVDAPVLIFGESGTGKELTAQAVHRYSSRTNGPFVPVNCGAIPHALIQSELFGYEKGAFTGASREKLGILESAAGGTIFLDEIGDLPLDLQTNLLRFLQEKTVNRVGSTQNIHVDLRVIAASHVNLEEAVATGKFREDLFYRLNVLPLAVPPLRERKDDIRLLAEFFFDKFSTERSRKLKGFTSRAITAMEIHDWPGNVRELINRTRRAMAMAEGRLITQDDLGLERRTVPRTREGLDDARTKAERGAIYASLQRTRKNITHAAYDLGISRMTLYRLMEKHGITP